MGRVRITAVLAAVTMLSGCWLQPGYDAGQTRYNPFEDQITAADVATLHEIWSQPGLGRVAVAPTEPILTGDGGVYLVQAGTLFGIDGATGAVRWSRQLHADYPFVTPEGDGWPVVAVGDELWVSWGKKTDANPPTGTCTGQVERVDPADGSTLGTVSTDGPAQVVPLGGGRVAVNAWVSPRCSGSSFLRVYDVGAGAPTLAWAADTATGGNPHAPVVVGDELLNGNRFYDVDGCGAPTCSPTRYLELPNGFDTGVNGLKISVSEGRTYVSGREHDGTSDQAPRLLVLDGTSGELLWRAVGYREPNVAVTPEWVFVAGTRTGEEGSPHSFLDAYPADGCGAAVCSPAWSASLGFAEMHHAVAVAGDVVYAGYRWYEGDPPYDDRLVAFDVDGCGAATCEPLAELELPGLADHIAVAGGRVVVHASGQGLVAFAAE